MTPKFPTGRMSASKIPDNKAPTMAKAGGAATDGGSGSAGKAVDRLKHEHGDRATMRDWKCGD